jgi:hypothetical protein
MSYRRAIEQLRPVRYPKENIQEKVQSFLTEADTSKATKAEMAICVAYNINQNKGMSEADAVALAGIESKKWDGVDTDTRDVGKKTADTMPNVGKKLIHSGAGKATNNYKKGTDTTPKADIVGDDNNLISLKKQGDTGSGAQLMSAKSGEATGVFEAALDHFKANESMKLTGDLAEVLNILGKEMEATARNDSFVEVRESKKDFAEWYTTISDTIKVGRQKIDTRFKQIENDRKVKGATDQDIIQFLELELKIIGVTTKSANAPQQIKKLQDKFGFPKVISPREFKKQEDAFLNDSEYKVGDVKISNDHIEKKGIDPKSLSDKKLKEQMIDIISTSIKSKPWADKLQEYFNNNQELKKWMVYEAASGLYKFTGKPSTGKKYKPGSKAVANSIMVFSDNGYVKSLDVLKYAKDNYNLIDSLDISYKASGASKYIKLGIKSSVEYDNSLPMLVERAIESEKLTLKEELYMLEKQYMLNEGIFQSIVNKAKEYYDRAKQAVFDFYNRVIKKYIGYLADLFKQGIKALLQGLGLEISDAKFNIATPSF